MGVLDVFKRKQKKSAVKKGQPENEGHMNDLKKEILPEQIGSRNRINKTIAVVSGKGGVGKSTISALLACGLMMRGYRVGILDADVTGPSIPKMFGIKGGNMAKNDYGMVPQESKMGIKIMSLNLFLRDENNPVIWRGPRIAGVVGQFYSQADWRELDFLILDMPPGTGDIAISVIQDIPLFGAVVVTTPQDMAFTIVRKAYQFLVKNDIEILGIAENLKTGICPHCKGEFGLFTSSGVIDWCEQNMVGYLGDIPWDAKLMEYSDIGQIEGFYSKAVNVLTDRLIASTISGRRY